MPPNRGGDGAGASIVKDPGAIRREAARDSGLNRDMHTQPDIIAAAFGPSEPTRLIESEALARRSGVARVLLKAENERPFGNFKILGGLPAGLKALARWSGTSVEALLADPGAHGGLPALVCASDGNHGLAVALAARAAGARAVVVLHGKVDRARAGRIAETGAEVVMVAGTYDDAVDHARSLADGGGMLLIPDTTDRPDDPVVADVMHGYRRITDEIAGQLAGGPPPTHVFVQAGVGGLAAAMAEGLRALTTHPFTVVAVEPAEAACVRHALDTGRIERVGGDLETVADMLSCGMASAPAVEILRRHRTRTVVVEDHDLHDAVSVLEREAGLRSSLSGAAGLAGLLRAGPDRAELGLDARSIVLLVVTEGPSGPSREGVPSP